MPVRKIANIEWPIGRRLRLQHKWRWSWRSRIRIHPSPLYSFRRPGVKRRRAFSVPTLVLTMKLVTARTLFWHPRSANSRRCLSPIHRLGNRSGRSTRSPCLLAVMTLVLPVSLPVCFSLTRKCWRTATMMRRNSSCELSLMEISGRGRNSTTWRFH